MAKDGVPLSVKILGHRTMVLYPAAGKTLVQVSDLQAKLPWKSPSIGMITYLFPPSAMVVRAATAADVFFTDYVQTPRTHDNLFP